MIRQIIDKLSSGDLSSQRYKDLFPELYSVKGLVENGPWHSKQDVFDHILKVFDSLNLFISEPSRITRKPQHLKNRLFQSVDNLSHANCLRIVCLFHDVAKKETLLVNSDGTTTCPGHEEIGAYNFSLNQKLGLSDSDKNAIVHMISLHGFVGSVLHIFSKTKKNNILDIFSKISNGFDVDLVLFMLSDLEGSDLESINHSAYTGLRAGLQGILDYYL